MDTFVYPFITSLSNVKNRVWMAKWLVYPPLMQKVAGSRPGRVIPKTIIKMEQTTSLLSMHA